MPDPDNIPLIGPVYRASTIEEAQDIPIVGNAIGTLNAVTNFVEYGCYPHWTVWVDTFWRPAGRVVLQLFVFDLGDILRGYFRPTNLRGIGSGTRMPMRGKKNKAGKTGRGNRKVAIPEIGNSVGKALPGSPFFQGRKVTGIERYLWILDGLSQRVLWYWLVAEITEDFVTEWTTAIMESEACRRPTTFYISAEKTGATAVFTGDWSRIIAWQTIERSGPGFWNGIGGALDIPAGHQANIAAAVHVSESGIGTVEGANVRLSVIGSGPQPTPETPWPVNSNDDPTTPTLTATIYGPAVVTVDVFPIGTGIVEYGDCVFSASISPL